MEMKNFYRPCCNVGNEEYISSNLNLDLTYATREKKWYFLKGNGISSTILHLLILGFIHSTDFF